MVGLNMCRWSVRRNGEEIERVTYPKNFDAQAVIDELVAHEGYEPNIEVRLVSGFCDIAELHA